MAKKTAKKFDDLSDAEQLQWIDHNPEWTRADTALLARVAKGLDIPVVQCDSGSPAARRGLHLRPVRALRSSNARSR